MLFAACGFVLGLLRLLKIFTNRQSYFYAFVAIGNLGNSIIGAVIYLHPDPTSDVTLFWILVGITFCLAGLLLIDIML